MRDVLVTGGCGLVGSAVVRRLCAAGRDVTVFDRPDLAIDLLTGEESIHRVTGDVRVPGDLARLSDGDWDLVFHLAAQTDVRASTQDPVVDFEVNAVGTLQVLEWARAHGVRRFIYPSTVAVYDPGADMPLAETARVAPTSPYGASKLAGESLARAWGRTYGLEVVIVRLFNAYGPGMTKYVIHDLVRKLEADPHRLTVLGTGEQIRDYLHVRDVAAALDLVASRASPDSVFNLGSGQPVRIADLARMIVQVMDLADVEVVFTGASWPGDIKEWYADPARLRELGWEPEVSLGDGLAETVAWMRAHPGQPSASGAA
ncbi:MAG: NAD-dependent epimerase/dehydratase family protein [Acidobacteriota bacterium]